jgi:hypothetical protein
MITQTRAMDYVDRFRFRAGLISWNATDLEACRMDPDLAQILHVAALLEEDTAITVHQGSSLGLDRSADLGEFLPQWALEEAEHGRALRFLLQYQDYESPERSQQSTALRRRAVARIPVRALARLPETSFLFCVLGAASEYVATVIYAELAKQSDEIPVEQLLRSIARQEARHFAFFLGAARLRGNRLATWNAHVARRVLRSIWEPIGVPTLGTSVWHDMFAGWLEDASFRERVEMMDRIVDSIPHLAGVRLMGRFLEQLPDATNLAAGCDPSELVVSELQSVTPHGADGPIGSIRDVPLNGNDRSV